MRRDNNPVIKPNRKIRSALRDYEISLAEQNSANDYYEEYERKRKEEEKKSLVNSRMPKRPEVQSQEKIENEKKDLDSNLDIERPSLNWDEIRVDIGEEFLFNRANKKFESSPRKEQKEHDSEKDSVFYKEADYYKQLEDTDKYMKSRSEDIERGFSFWDSVLKSVLSVGSQFRPGSAGYTNTPESYQAATQVRKNIKDDSYTRDVWSTLMVGKNKAEIKGYLGKNTLLDEKEKYVNGIFEFKNGLKQLTQLETRLNNLRQSGKDVYGLTVSLLKDINNTRAYLDKMIPFIDEATTYDLSTTTREAFADLVFSSVAMDNPMTSKRSIGEAAKELVDLYKEYRNGNNVNTTDRLNKLGQEISKKYREFESYSKKEHLNNLEGAKRNEDELRSWLAWHTPSAEFLAKAEANQDNYLTRLGTYKYGIWNTIGSSMAFNGIQLVSTALDYLGAGLLFVPHPAAKAAGLAATAAGAGLGIESGKWENRSEIGDNYVEAVRNDLNKEGLLDDFLKDGRKLLKQKNIQVDDDEDVFNAMLAKKYVVKDPRMLDIMEKHLFGANNAYQNDMMAVSFDVAFNAGLNIFGPTGTVAEMTKIIPVSRFGRARMLSKMPKIVQNIATTGGHAGTELASTISPVFGAGYRVLRGAAKPLTTAASKALEPMVNTLSKNMDNVFRFMNVAPKTLFNTGTTTKYAFKFGGQLISRGVSEAIEEGKQYEYGKQFLEGKFAGKSNSIFETLLDDLSTGSSTALAFVGHLLFGLLADKDLMANMRGGFLGGILNHGSLISGVQSGVGAVKEMSAGQIVFNNVMAEKLKQRSAIANGSQFAKYHSASGYRAMMDAFDRFIDIHNKITEDSSERYGLSEEVIERQREHYKRIYNLYNNEFILKNAERLGIEKNSKDYRTYVSLIDLANQQIDETNDRLTNIASNLLENALSIHNENIALHSHVQQLANISALEQLVSEIEDLVEFATLAQKLILKSYKDLLSDYKSIYSEWIQSNPEELEGKDLNLVETEIKNGSFYNELLPIYRTMNLYNAQQMEAERTLGNLLGIKNVTPELLSFVQTNIPKASHLINSIRKSQNKAVNAQRVSTDRDKSDEKRNSARALIDEYNKSIKSDVDLLMRVNELMDSFYEKQYVDNNSQLEVTGYEDQNQNAVYFEDLYEENQDEIEPEPEGLVSGGTASHLPVVGKTYSVFNGKVKNKYTVIQTDDDFTEYEDQYGNRGSLPTAEFKKQIDSYNNYPVINDIEFSDFVDQLQLNSDHVFSGDYLDENSELGIMYLIWMYTKQNALYKQNGVENDYDLFIKRGQRYNRIPKTSSVVDRLFAPSLVESVFEKKIQSILLNASRDQLEFESTLDLLQKWYNDELDDSVEKEANLKKYLPVHKKTGRNIDLSIYKQFRTDIQAISNISKILSDERKVTGNNLIKDIIKDIFFSVLTNNSFKYDYSGYFKSGILDQTINNINEVKSRINSLGYTVVSVNDTNLNVTDQNLSGSTDVIAIDKFGKIHIYNLSITKPENKLNDNIDTKVRLFAIGAEQTNKTYRLYYEELAEANLLALPQQLRQKVESYTLVPITVGRTFDRNNLSDIGLVSSFGIFDFIEIRPSSNFNNFVVLTGTANYVLLRLNIKQKLQNILNSINDIYDEEVDILTIPDLIYLRDAFNTLKKRANSLGFTANSRHNPTYAEYVTLNRLIDSFEKYVNEINQRILNQQVLVPSRPKIKPITQTTNIPVDFDQTMQDINNGLSNIEQWIERVNDGSFSIGKKIWEDAKNFLGSSLRDLTKIQNQLIKLGFDNNSNEIKRVRKIYKDIQDLLNKYPETYKNINDNTPRGEIVKTHLVDPPFNSPLFGILYSSDFAKASDIELMYGEILDDGTVKKLLQLVVSDKTGVFATFTYKGIKYGPIIVKPSHYKEGLLLNTEDGNKFIEDVLTLLNSGVSVMATCRRTAPMFYYNQTVLPVTTNPVLKNIFTDEYLHRINCFEEVGIVNSNGQLMPIALQQGQISLWKFKPEDAGKIFYTYSLNFDEYPDSKLIVPIRLIPQKVKDDDVDVIIKILSLNYEGDGNMLNSPYIMDNGEESPFTNMLVLSFYYNFDVHAGKNSLIYINSDGLVYLRLNKNQNFSNVPVDPTSQEGRNYIKDFFNGAELPVNKQTLISSLDSETDPLFGKLKSYLLANGSLNISSNLQFDKSDVENNGYGAIKGIGWSLKHGRLCSNVSSFVNPKIIIEDLSSSISSNDIQQSVEQAPEISPKKRKKNLFGDITGGNVFLTTFDVEQNKNNRISIEQAKENISRILGDDFVSSRKLHVVDDIIKVLEDGALVLGITSQDGITLSTFASVGDEYHESFHRVLELLLTQKERNKIYKAYLRKHPEINSTDYRSITEGLAEEFKKFALNKDNVPDSELTSIWKRIRNFFKALRQIGSWRLYRTYKKVYNGKYANRKPTQSSIERFNDIFSIGNNESELYIKVYDQYLKEDVELQHIITQKQYDAAISTIATFIIRSSAKDIFGQKFGKTEITESFVKNMKINDILFYEALTLDLDDVSLMFKDIFDNFSSILPDLCRELKKYGLYFKRTKVDTIAQDQSNLQKNEEDFNEGKSAGDVESQTADIGQYTIDDNEISKINKAGNVTKFFLSTIPDCHFVMPNEVDENGNKLEMYVPIRDENGDYRDINGNIVKKDDDGNYYTRKNGVFVKDNTVVLRLIRNITSTYNELGYNQFMPFRKVFNKILNDCNDVNDLDELKTRFKELRDSDPLYVILYKKFALELLNSERKQDKNGYYTDVDGKKYELYSNGKFKRLNKNNEPIGELLDASEINFIPDYNSLSIVVSVFNDITGRRNKFLVFRSKRESEVGIIYELTDANGSYTASRYTLSWHQWFLNSDAIKRTVGYNQHAQDTSYMYTLKDPNLFLYTADAIERIIGAYTDRTNPSYTSGVLKIGLQTFNIYKDPIGVMQYYISLLNQIGIDVDVKHLQKMLVKMYGRADSFALRNYFSQKSDDTISRGVSMWKFINSIRNAVKQNGSLSPILLNGSFYTKTGVILQLANAKYDYNQQTTSLMERMPGGKKRYGISNRTNIDNMMLDLNNPNSKFIADLMSNPYWNSLYGAGKYSGCRMLRYLATGLIRLESVIDAGYRSSVPGDTGVDFMLMDDAADFLSKMLNILDNKLIFPTISNKKTYPIIQFVLTKTNKKIQLPGILYIQSQNDNKVSSDSISPYKVSNMPILYRSEIDGKWLFKLPDNVYDALIGYAYSEYNFVKQNILNRSNISDSEKITNFDVATKGATIPGCMRFGRFYGVYVPEQRQNKDGLIYYKEKYINFDNQNNTTAQSNLKLAEDVFFGDDVTDQERREMIDRLVMHQLDNLLQYAEQIGVIERKTDVVPGSVPYFNYKPGKLSSVHVNSIIRNLDATLRTSVDKALSAATCTLLLDFLIKSLISFEEIQRLFGGYPGLFVTQYDESGNNVNDQEDLSKRYGGHISTGETNCRLKDTRNEYVCSELKDFKTSSEMYEDLKNWFMQSEKTSTLFGVAKTNISRNVSSNFNLLQQYIIRAFLSHKTIDPSIITQYFDNLNIPEYLSNRFVLEMQQMPSENQKQYIKQCVYKIKKEALSFLIKQEYNRQKKLTDQQVIDELKSKKLYEGVVKRATNYANSYTDNRINVADGASFVGPEMVKLMLLKIGKFDGSVYKAYKLLTSKQKQNPLDAAESYKIINNALFGTQKYTATGYRMNNGVPVFYYNKTALFPLFPQMAYGKTHDLLNLMKKLKVDMVMMESSVKYGSLGAQSFPENKEELSNFIFNKYNQDFKYLIKQLNTDPNEKETMSVGTLALKIALDNLDIYIDDYIDRDGNVESGLEIRERLFKAMRKSTELKNSYFLNRFFDNSGEFKQKEFSIWLTDNLQDRDADKNMLSGLAIDKEGKMKSSLSGISNFGWSLSVLISEINKQIINVNLPGSAFVLRSCFLMEKGNILGDSSAPTIYNGKKLKMVNEQGSMDAVISIDYFYTLFPHLKEMSFNDARQWLISHKIIGEEARAETMAYRIPTQAASSIHALRFVDVINTVRDTIVLPEEFTAITGSDFDIDKLFLTTKFMKYDEATDTVSQLFDSNTIEYWDNIMLECFLELLVLPLEKFANKRIRSIDNDTDISKKIADKITQFKETEKHTYDVLNVATQCKIKSENRVGSIGISPNALNNNSQEMTRLFDVEFLHKGICEILGLTSMHDDINEDGDPIMGQIGSYMNGNLDIAKGAWISEINQNEYTYDLYLFLTRTGFGDKSIFLCCQPIIRLLSNEYRKQQSYLFNETGISHYSAAKHAFRRIELNYFIKNADKDRQELIKSILNGAKNGYLDGFGYYTSFDLEQQELLNLYNNIIKVGSIIRSICNVNINDPHVKTDGFTDTDGKHHDMSILEDIMYNYNSNEYIKDKTKRYRILYKSVKKDGSFTIETEDLSINDVQFYVYIANEMMLNPISEMRNIVQNTKPETKKFGKTIAEQYVSVDKYNRLFKDGENRYVDVLALKDMVLNSFIHTKFMSATNITRLLLSNVSIEASNSMLDQWVPDFLRKTSLPVTVDSVLSIIDSISSFIKYEFIDNYARQNGIIIKDLFSGNNSIYNRLGAIKSKIKSRKGSVRYANYIDDLGNIQNSLLSHLEPANIPTYADKDYEEGLPKFVELLFKDDEDDVLSNDIISSWQQMLEDDDNPDLLLFARDLIVYSFVTSGDISGPGGNLFRLVPFVWREQMSKIRIDNSFMFDLEPVSYVLFINKFIDYSNNPYKYPVDAENVPILYDESTGMSNENVFVNILKTSWYNPNLVQEIYATSKNIDGDDVSNFYSVNTSAGVPAILATVLNRLVIDLEGNKIKKRLEFYDSSLDRPKLVIKVKKALEGSNDDKEDYYFYEFLAMGSCYNTDGRLINFPIYSLIDVKGGLFYGHRIIEYGNFNFDWEINKVGLSNEERKQRQLAFAALLYDHMITMRGKLNNEELTPDLKLLKSIAYGYQLTVFGRDLDGNLIDLSSGNRQMHLVATMIAAYDFTNNVDPERNESLEHINLHPEKVESNEISIKYGNGDSYSHLSNLSERNFVYNSNILDENIKSLISDFFTGKNSDNKLEARLSKNKEWNGLFNSVELGFLIIKLVKLYSFLKDKQQDDPSNKNLELAIKHCYDNIKKLVKSEPGYDQLRIGHERIFEVPQYIDEFFNSQWNQHGAFEDISENTSYKIMYELVLLSLDLTPSIARLLQKTNDKKLVHPVRGLLQKLTFERVLEEIRESIKGKLFDDVGKKIQIKYKPLIIVPANQTAAKAREIGGIDALRHFGYENGMHYGNPFTHLKGEVDNGKASVLTNTVKEATEMFELWLRGTAYQDIEPERRLWIWNQIQNGSLVDKPIVYYTNKVPDDSYGVGANYDYANAPNHAHILQKLIIEFAPLRNNTDVYILHSGGAVGADSMWDDYGQQYGIISNHYYHGRPTPRGNILISDADFEEGRQHIIKANETLKRKNIDRYMDLLARNYSQVKNADAIFAIGHLVNGIVDGGTGYAVLMAIDDKKPVYVFDPERNAWYKNVDGKWSTSEVPSLTPNFAGIGTRRLDSSLQNAYSEEIRQRGIDAIKAVYDKTFNVNVDEETKSTLESMESGSNFGEHESKSIKNVLGIDHLPKVMMASEHTDPSFHADKIVELVNKELAKPSKDRQFHMLLIMTKHDGIPLRKMLELKIPKTVHFSITSLGGTKWEPGVMKPDDLLDRILVFINEGLLNPSLITVRIDPIIPGVTTQEGIEHIMKRASEMGIKQFKFSVMDSYGYTQEGVRTTNQRDRFIIQKMSQLGYNWDSYYGRFPNGEVKFDAKPYIIEEIYKFMDDLAVKYDVWINTCGEKPRNIPNLRRIKTNVGCLNVETINKVLGTNDVVQKEGNQRPGSCHCFDGKMDALRYDDTCASACAYCYAYHNSNAARKYYNEDGTLRDDVMTRTGFEKSNDGLMFHINPKKKPQLIDAVKKKNPSIIKRELDEAFDFLESLPNLQEDNAYVEACIRWLKNSSIVLPRDNEKVRQAFDFARKNNVDIQKCLSPIDIIILADKDKTITWPEPLQNLNKYKKLEFSHEETLKTGEVVQVYDIEDSKEGQNDAVQFLADTAPIGADGKKSEMFVWCLCTYNYNKETGIATPTNSARNYWNTYNKGKRQVAVLNNKPIAFNSSSSNADEWWDFNDRSHSELTDVNPNIRESRYKKEESLTKWIDTGRYTYVENNGILESIIYKENFRELSESEISRISYDTGQGGFLPELNINFRLSSPYILSKLWHKLNLQMYSNPGDLDVNIALDSSFILRLSEDKRNKVNNDIKSILVDQLIHYDYFYRDYSIGDVAFDMRKLDSLRKTVSDRVTAYIEENDLLNFKKEYNKPITNTEPFINWTNRVHPSEDDLPFEINLWLYTEPLGLQETALLDLVQTRTNISQEARQAVVQRYSEYVTQEEVLQNYYIDEQEGNLYFVEKDLNQQFIENPDLYIEQIIEQDQLSKEYDEYIVKPLNQELTKHLHRILKKYHFEIIEDNLENVFGEDALGALDFLEKVVYLSKNGRNAITDAEEFSHAFFKMLGSAYHRVETRNSNPKIYKLYSELRDMIEQTEFYKKVYSEYKDIYKYENGNINTSLIKEEALGKALAAVLNRRADEKQFKADKTFFLKLKQLFKNFLDWFKSLEEKVYISLTGEGELKNPNVATKTSITEGNTLEQELEELADSILDGTYFKKYLKKDTMKNKKLQDYRKTMENSIKNDNGTSVRIMLRLTRLGGYITGSISYRKQGTVYRTAIDSLHDIDAVFYNDSYNGDLYVSKEHHYTLQEIENELVRSRAINVINDIKTYYLNFDIVSMFASDGKFIVNGIICSDENIKNKFKNATGNFNERLLMFTQEERNKIYLIDLFFIPNNADRQDTIYENEYGINLTRSNVSFQEKLKFGRIKDLFDYQHWRPYERRYRIQENSHGATNILYQQRSVSIEFDASQLKQDGINRKEECK